MTRALAATLAALPLLAMTPDPLAAQAGAPPPGTVTWHTYAGEGGSRRYRLFVPDGVDAARPAPLVVMLHGCTQTPDDFAAGTGFDAHAAARGVIVAWPEQTAAAHPQTCWSWYDPAHQRRGAGEPAILAGIAREVAARHPVDAARVFVVGMSAGGAMALNAAASYPDVFAGAAVHSGVAYRAAEGVPRALAAMRSGAADPDALPALAAEAVAVHGGAPRLLVLHGAADAVVSARNGEQAARQWAVATGLGDPVEDTFAAGGRDVTRRRWAGPDGRSRVELWRVAEEGHAWLGGRAGGSFTTPRGPDASAAILAFLLDGAAR